MPTVAEVLAIAEQHYQARRFRVAEPMYQQVLSVEPNNVPALHRLALIAQARGRYEDAVACLRRAIEFSGNDFSLHASLGEVLQAQGKIVEAIKSFQRALQLNPNDAAIYNSLGNALKQLGQLDFAKQCYCRAIEIKSHLPDSHINLGTVLQIQNKLDEAAKCYERAIELQPTLATPFYNLGTIRQTQIKLDEAVIHYQRATELDPSFARAFNNLGNVYKDQGKRNEAVACYNEALKLDPNYAAAHGNLGNVFLADWKLEAAIACFRQSIKLRPQQPETHNSLATALKDQGEYGLAMESFDAAIQLKPDYAEAHSNRSMVRLLLGDYERGWVEYEWRWKTNQLGNLHFSRPQWDGRPLERQTLLIHAEQGLGDTIEFVRYASLVKQHNPLATIVLRCQSPLIQLLAGCGGIDGVIAEKDKPPPFDFHSPLLSLPRIFRTTLDNIPDCIPYLFADAKLVAFWRRRMAGVKGFRIGINWQGRQGEGEFRRRDIDLQLFASLAEMPTVQLVSLQKGEGRDELLRSNLPILDLGEDVDTTNGRFLDTAAIITNLDLVITSDTSLPHLAAALGVPVWVALPFVSSWQWMCDRVDSPWYPTTRLFRQKSIGDWNAVFEEFRAELSKLVSGASR